MKRKISNLFPEVPSKVGLNEYSLKFDKEREDEYNKKTMDILVSQKRAGIAFGIILFLVFSMVDYLMVPKLDAMMWVFKFSIIVPVFAVGYILTYFSVVKRNLGYTISMLMVIVSGIHFFSLTYIPSDILSKYYLSFIILLIYAFTLMKVDFVSSSIMLTFMSALYVVFIVSLDSIFTSEKIASSVLVFIVLLIGVIYLYQIDYMKRRCFDIDQKTKKLLKQIKSKSDVESKNDEKDVTPVKAEDTKAPDEKAVDKPVTKKTDTESKLTVSEKQAMLEHFNYEKARLTDNALFKVIKSLPNVCCVVDENSVIKYASAQFAETIIGNVKKDRKNNFADYINKLDRERFQESARKKHRDKELIKKTFSVKESSGKYTNFQLAVSNMKGDKGELYYIIFLESEQVTETTIQAPKDTQKYSKEDKILLANFEELKKKQAKLELDYDDVISDNKKLTTKNSMLMADLDNVREKMRVLALQKDDEETTKNEDEIRIMNRIASYYANQITRYQRELIKILEESFLRIAEIQDRDFVEGYYLDNKQNLLKALYQSGAVQFRIELYEYLLNAKPVENPAPVELRSLLQNSLTKLARYFEYTENVVEVSCPKDLVIKSPARSIELIVQNFVITSLYLIISKGVDGLISVNVIDDRSKIIIEYKDNGKKFEPYYYDLINVDKIDSNILSVNGIEFYLAKEIIRKELKGEIEIIKDSQFNKIKISFYK